MCCRHNTDSGNMLFADLCRPHFGCAIPSAILTLQATIPTLGEASAEALAPLLGGLPLELRPKMETFIQGVYAVSTLIMYVISACCEAVVTHTRPLAATSHGRG